MIGEPAANGGGDRPGHCRRGRDRAVRRQRHLQVAEQQWDDRGDLRFIGPDERRQHSHRQNPPTPQTLRIFVEFPDILQSHSRPFLEQPGWTRRCLKKCPASFSVIHLEIHSDPGGEPRALLLGRAQCRVKVSVAFLSTVFRPVMTWVKSRSPPAP